MGAIAGGAVALLPVSACWPSRRRPGRGSWMAGSSCVGRCRRRRSGGIIGALVESGTSKENAELYAEALRRARIVTAKVSDSDETKYAAIMNKSAFDIAARETAYRSSGW